MIFVLFKEKIYCARLIPNICKIFLPTEKDQCIISTTELSREKSWEQKSRGKKLSQNCEVIKWYKKHSLNIITFLKLLGMNDSSRRAESQFSIFLSRVALLSLVIVKYVHLFHLFIDSGKFVSFELEDYLPMHSSLQFVISGIITDKMPTIMATFQLILTD